MNKGIRPQTIEKYERALRLLRDNPEIERGVIYKRVGISPRWFRELGKRIKKQKEQENGE